MGLLITYVVAFVVGAVVCFASGKRALVFLVGFCFLLSAFIGMLFSLAKLEQINPKCHSFTITEVVPEKLCPNLNDRLVILNNRQYQIICQGQTLSALVILHDNSEPTP